MTTTTNTTDKALLLSFVADCTAYQSNSARLDKLKEEQSELVSKNGDLRKAIVPVFKSLSAHKWNAIKADIKNAIIEAEIKDVDGLLGVLRTSFEYKILPTQANADRLRKAEKWVNWLGIVVPNTYKAVQTKPVEAEATKPDMTKTIEAVKTAIQTASAPSTETASAVKATEKKGEIDRPNVSASSDSLTTSEHWDTLYAQFMKHGMTAFYIKALAGALNTDESALFKTMTAVHNDIMAQAQKIEAKKK
jgi:nitrogen fixation protein FixH